MAVSRLSPDGLLQSSDLRVRTRRVRLLVICASLWLPTTSLLKAQQAASSSSRTDYVAGGRDGQQEGSELVWVVKSNRGTIAVIDPATDSIIDLIDPRWGVTGDAIAIGDGAVWVSYLSSWVHRIDPVTREVVATVETQTYNGGIAVGSASVWVGNGDDSRLTRIAPGTNQVAGSVTTEYMVYDVAMTDNSVWAATTQGQIERFAPNASAVADIIKTDGEPNSLAGDGGTLWASDLIFGRVLRVGPGGGVEPIDVGVTSMEGPGLAVGFGSVWVGTGDNNMVIRIDAASSEILAMIELEGWVEDVAVGAGSVWVALPEDARVVRIDPATNEVTARIRVTGFPNAIAVGH